MATLIYNLKRTTTQLLLLLVALCCGSALTAQNYYTLTNGRLYWWEGDASLWDNNTYTSRLTEVAFDKANGWKKIHLFESDESKITHVTQMGQYYLALKVDIENDPTHPELEALTTGWKHAELGEKMVKEGVDQFSKYCVWQRSGNTGYYYQEHEASNGTVYRYFLVGDRGELKVECKKKGDPIDYKYWYDWDFGAAVKDMSYRNGSSSESDYWLYYNEKDGKWMVNDRDCYQRPEDVYYENGYQYLSADDTEEQRTAKNNHNQTNKHYYYEKDGGKAGNGALFLPVNSKYVEKHIEAIAEGFGLTGAKVVLAGSDPEVEISASRRLDYNETATITPSINVPSGTKAQVQEGYTHFRRETFRYGINLYYLDRSTDAFNSKGIATIDDYYFYDSDPNTQQLSAPTTHEEPLTAEEVSFELDRRSSRYLTLTTTGSGTARTATIKCINMPESPIDAIVHITVRYTDGLPQTIDVPIPLNYQFATKAFPTEAEKAPLIAGNVFGGGRMANVGGNTRVSIHSCDSIRGVYGGNDIAGWVQGTEGATVNIGTEHTDATHPVRVGWVYGGGCGKYTYTGVASTTENETRTQGLQKLQYYFTGHVYDWEQSTQQVTETAFSYTPTATIGEETGNGGNGTIPYVKKTQVNIGTVDGRDANNYIVIDSLFGGAENAFVGSNGHDATVNMHGGTVFALFGGNNYGGAVAPEGSTEINIHYTKLSSTYAEITDLPYYGYGRTFGIRNLFGGGNHVESNHTMLNVRGGMIDTCYLGGNEASVEHPFGLVDCTGDDYIYDNSSIATDLHLQNDADWDKLAIINPGHFTPGQRHNIRTLFGGNNKAPMTSLSSIDLQSGGVGKVYGGGNAGDMRNATLLKDYQVDNPFEANTKITLYELMQASALQGWRWTNNMPKTLGSIVFSQEDSRIMVDNVYGGCRMANVTHSSAVWLQGGCFGYVHGGNDISGDVGSETNEGTWVVLDGKALVLQNVYGGSDGYYHCHEGIRYADDGNSLRRRDDVDRDPYDEYVNLLTPTQNNSNLYIKGGTVLYSAYGGGVMTDIGEGDQILQIQERDRAGDEGYDANGMRQLKPSTGAKQGSVRFQISGGTIGSATYHPNAGTTAQTNRKNITPADHRANHDGNAYGGGYLSNLLGAGYLYINGSPRIYGSLFTGNDCLGSIENFSAYASHDGSEGVLYASDGTTKLNRDNNTQAEYSAYVLIEGTPNITCVYGGGNGAYNYHSPERPEYSSREPVCANVQNMAGRPEQESALIDIHTNGGMIDTVFGGGNGVGVREGVKVLFNSQAPEMLTVKTIFGGNNRDDMNNCVPEIALLQGTVNNIYGGGNAGSMGCVTDRETDVCGNEIDSVSTHIVFNSDKVTVKDTVFGGCRMADVAGRAFIEVFNTAAEGINYLFGGNDISGNVTGNTRIDVVGGTVRNIFGGGNGRYDYEKIDNIDGEDIFRVYTFGHSEGTAPLVSEAKGMPFVDATVVNLYGGTITTDVFGGGNLADCRTTLVEVDNQVCPAKLEPKSLTIEGSIYGGGQGIWDDLNQPRRGNVVKVETNDAAASTNVHLRSATTLSSAKAYGGGRGGDVDNTYITVYDTWKIQLGELYGGCWGSDVHGTTHVQVASKDDGATNNINYLFGGNDFTGNVYKTSIQVDGGRIGYIYGGGNGQYAETLYTEATSEHDYSTEANRLYAPNNEAAVINFTDGTVSGNVYGGGRQGTTLAYRKWDSEGTDANGVHHYAGEYVFDANGRMIADTSRTDASTPKYSTPDKYASIIVNLRGGNVLHHVFAGAQGVTSGPQLVYGLKMLNMDGGIIGESAYGGSESVNDGYPAECIDKDNTTMRPSSILNIAAGTVTNNVYGGGYLGVVYGSTYINVGREAIKDSPVWRHTINEQENAYAAYQPGYPNGVSPTPKEKGELQLIASIYSGANWGNNSGNADFSKAGFYGGESRIHIDGKGYRTFLNEEDQGLDQMNIGKSIIGSGTSAEGGDIYRRIDIRNYGALSPTCSPTRSLLAVQRADALYLHNTVIDYLGTTDAISAYLSNQVTLNRIDTINCIGYNVIDVNATATNIGAVNFYQHKDNFYTDAEDVWPYKGLVLTDRTTYERDILTACSENATFCDQLGHLVRKPTTDNPNAYTAFVMNNGINIDLIHIDKDGHQIYSPVMGYAFIIAEPNTNAIISAMAKFSEASGSTPAQWAQKDAEYGGFLPVCKDLLKTFTATGSNKEKLEWAANSSDNNAEYEYFNYGTMYRVWSIGNGVRRRYSVVHAHATPTQLPDENQNFTSTSPSYDLALAHATILLPPTMPGHYYKINSNGVAIDDVNDEMRLVSSAWSPTSWSDITGTGSEWEGTTYADNINENAGTHFGLLMTSGSHFSGSKPITATNSTQERTLLSGTQTVNELNNFMTYQVGDKQNTSPELDLFLTYKPGFSNTLLGTVTFTLEECVSEPRRNKVGEVVVDTTGGTIKIATAYQSSLALKEINGEKYLVSPSDPNQYVNAEGEPVDEDERVTAVYDHSLNTDIWVEVTINTILSEFSDMKHELLAMYNAGRNNLFVRKAILPATLEQRDVYLKSVEWTPTDSKGINGDNNLFKLTSDSLSIIEEALDKHDLFSIRILPIDDMSGSQTSTEGWYTRDYTSSQDILSLCGVSGPSKSSSGAIDCSKKIGTLDGHGSAAINIELVYDGNRLYDDIPDKGYVGKAILHMASYKTGIANPTENPFDITVYVKTRKNGDTIYVASAETLHFTDGENNYDLTALKSEEDFKPSNQPGKSPQKYINDLNRALQSDIYQEGDVVAVMGTIVIPEGHTLRVRGQEYNPIPIIRYYGHHHEAPGEACVFRGTMFDVHGNDANFNALSIDFQGSLVGRLETANDEDAQRIGSAEGDYHKYADTNVAYGPIISVHSGGTVQLAAGTVVEENYNGYEGSDKHKYGAINVGSNGTLNLLNNVTIRNNLSLQQTGDGVTNDADLMPLNGAVYVNGGTIDLLTSHASSAVTIQDNFLHTKDGSEYWTKVLDENNDLLRYAFDLNKVKTTEQSPLANVLLTRTPETEGNKMEDMQTDVIHFSSDLPAQSRIGVRKWFPGITERDTIQIVYSDNGSNISSAYANGIFTSDDGHFVFANAGVDDWRIYLQRCATFRMQQTGISFPAYASSLTPKQVLDYLPYTDGTCPRGEDTVVYRVQGGFFPYLYNWTYIEKGETDTTHYTDLTPDNHGLVRSQAQSGNYTLFEQAVESRYITQPVNMTGRSDQDLLFTVEASDATQHCFLRKNVEVKVTLKATGSNFTYTDDANWKSSEESNTETIVTASGTRNFPGVRITPVVWSTEKMGSIIARKIDEARESIYSYNDEIPHEFEGNDYLCQGDRLRLVTQPHKDENGDPTSRFIMWDFDPYYTNDIIYTVPAHDATVVAYYGPLDYWKDVINTPEKGHVAYDNHYTYTYPTGKSFVVDYHNNVHIYDEKGLAWFISTVNGLNGTQATTYYFNDVYLHAKEGGYDMKDHLWTPVGTPQYPFRGRFIGTDADKTSTTKASEAVVIKHITVDEPNADYAGLFAVLKDATVENIHMESALIRGSQLVGAIAAKSEASHLSTVKVSSHEEEELNETEFTTQPTTILTTRHTSGGLVGHSKEDTFDKDVSAGVKYVGDAVYTGGIVGYGYSTDITNSISDLTTPPNRNLSHMSALYSGGLAGYLDGKAPVGLFSRSRKGVDGRSQVMNNYVRMAPNTGRNTGGLVGHAENTVIANNYVYGQLGDGEQSGAVVGEAYKGTVATYNYYAQSSQAYATGSLRGNASVTESHTFSGHGNQVHLASPSHGVTNLTRALNLWVRSQEEGQFLTWRSDLYDENNGYPIFGQPDLIPVSDTLTITGCDSVEWDGITYLQSAIAESHVIDSVMMVDSTTRLVIMVNHSSHQQYADSSTLGQNYAGYGFSFSAAEAELLRATVQQYGHATIVLTDTLQNPTTGCDSIVSLVLTIGDDGSRDLEVVEPEAPRHALVKIYPNPTTGRATVEADGIARVEVYDNAGHRLQDYTTGSRNSIVIDLTGYASGYYYLRVHTETDITIQKLIKK